MGTLSELLKKENIIIQKIISNEFPYPSLIICAIDKENKKGESFLLLNNKNKYSVFGIKFSFKEPNNEHWGEINLTHEAMNESTRLYNNELSKLDIFPLNPFTKEIDLESFAFLRYNESFVESINKIFKVTSFKELKDLEVFCKLPKFDFVDLIYL